MKTIEEWKRDRPSLCGVFDTDIMDIQSDAYHAGKLEGLADAKEIIKGYGGSDNDAPNQAARQIAFEIAKQ